MEEIIFLSQTFSGEILCFCLLCTSNQCFDFNKHITFSSRLDKRWPFTGHWKIYSQGDG